LPYLVRQAYKAIPLYISKVSLLILPVSLQLSPHFAT
jgi:hypothetical protein